MCLFGLVSEPRAVSAQLAPNTQDIDFSGFQKSVGLVNTNILALIGLTNLDVSKVISIPISYVLNNNNILTFNNLINKNQFDIDFLQHFLNNNLNKNTIIVKDVLSGNKVELNKVLAINVVAPFVVCFHH